LLIGAVARSVVRHARSCLSCLPVTPAFVPLGA
jgi:hypothetical protein